LGARAGVQFVEAAGSIGRAERRLGEMMAETYIPPVNSPGADILRYFDLL
jgi:hypothetical protein